MNYKYRVILGSDSADLRVEQGWTPGILALRWERPVSGKSPSQCGRCGCGRRSWHSLGHASTGTNRPEKFPNMPSDRSAEAGDPRRKPQPRAFAMFSKMRHSEVRPRSAKARTAGEESTTEDVSEILLVFAGLLGPLQCAEEPCGARASVGTREGGRGQGVLTPRHWREADSRALVGSDDGSLSLWRVESGECLARPSWAWGVSLLFLCETCAKNSLAAGLPATSASCGQFMQTGPVAKFHSRPFLHTGTRDPRIRGSGTRSVWSLRWLPKTLGPRALCAKRWS